MNEQEFLRLVDAYGADERRWPDEYRDRARRFLRDNKSLEEHLERVRALDQAIDQFAPEINLSRLEASILAQIPKQVTQPSTGLIDRLLDWLMPDPGNLFGLWRPTLAAALPLVIGIVLGGNLNLPATDSVDSWDDEIYLLALGDDPSEVVGVRQ